MEDSTMHCAVCGASIAERQAATLLSDPARELEQVKEHFDTKWGPSRFTTELGIDELPATNAGKGFFTADDDGRRVTPCSSDESVAGADRYYIPVHNYCLALAKRILASRHGRICSMRQLWKVLRTRCLSSVASGRAEPLARIDAPDGYHLPPREADADEYDGWCTADAWDIPDLTAGVLAQMTPSNPSLDDASSSSSSSAGFRARFERLPQELKDHVLSFVFTEHHFPPDCTRLMPQTAWMDLLMQAQLVPYLWDLRRDEVEKKVAEGRARGVEWDFELLVRRLCQSRSAANGASLSSMPDGLRNRQRIWELVEAMHIGDFLPLTTSASPSGAPDAGRPPAAIPRYWDEEGTLQYPLVWMRRLAGAGA
ncbi:factor for adipocyte protein [Diplodia corticola]|uniref:Factor for adipocyte protein n=1 Tax=Diplodia corticola TaxID=236234 RepID=A0A1J9QS24_9PEZI|nr:factor for adipocyte protein [Diplodia corticola]OJD31758.1 factor for adipocyte protein [Diplodia corticola]